MLEVANMGLHVGQMTGITEMRQAFKAVTSNAAEVLALENYGLEPGCNADMVILQAADPIEALRLRANRLFVIRRGEVIAESAPVKTTLRMFDSESVIRFSQAELNKPVH